MDSKSLTREQAEKLRNSIRPHLNFFLRLRQRMEKTGFPNADSLYRLVLQAEDKAQALFVHLHYLSCGSGVGRKSGEDLAPGNDSAGGVNSEPPPV